MGAEIRSIHQVILCWELNFGHPDCGGSYAGWVAEQTANKNSGNQKKERASLCSNC